MRHGKKINHLSRTAPHRKAMLSNMATSLIQNKRIVTTVAKAKALRKYVEPIITKAKTDTTHSRRMVFRYLQDKESVSMLFSEVSDKVADRPGGYTRILKTGNRLGDNASMCVIELVDYNESLLKDSKPKKAKTRRSRRGKGGAETAAVAAAAVSTDAVVEEAQEVIETENTAAAAVVDEVTETTPEEGVVETADESVSESEVAATQVETASQQEEEAKVVADTAESTVEQTEQVEVEKELPVADDKEITKESSEQQVVPDAETQQEEE